MSDLLGLPCIHGEDATVCEQCWPVGEVTGLTQTPTPKADWQIGETLRKVGELLMDIDPRNVSTTLDDGQKMMVTKAIIALEQVEQELRDD